jgi:hypothetical protein
VKKTYFKKMFIILAVICLGLAVSYAEIKQVNVLDRSGKVVERYSLEIVGSEAEKANTRMKYFWFCWSKKMFNGFSCDMVDSNIISTPANNVFAQQVPVQQQQNQTEQVHSTQPTSGNQIIYQVIERAVPGPQGPVGPAGRPGVDATILNNNNVNLAAYSTSPTYSAQYNGFGIQSNNAVNPTGDASLSTISGSGLSACNSTTSKILYNSTTKLFECGTDLNTGGGGFLGGDLSAQNIFATTSIQTPVIYASTTYATTSNAQIGNITNLASVLATFTSATATSLFVSNASITNATSTNIFSSILNSLTSTIADLLFTNATGTNATTTNLFSSNITNANFSSTGSFLLATGTISSTTILYGNFINTIGNLATFTSGTTTSWYTTNSSTSNLVAGNATFSYATVTNGFFTNLSVTGPVSAALSNGFIFRGGTNNFSEATSTIFVADSGKVGVGSTTPTEKFSIEGNLLVSGNIVSPRLSNLPDSVSGSDQFLCVTSTGQVVKDNLGTQLCFSSIREQQELRSTLGP